ncbi:glycoside hydrolase/deacetylase [Rhizoclosmatium globosum]|uniref:Glycoside hydrolase/deacetylase n=1 Tax=Rhizoclosmatium globosum TaxID=329046 RepID=A0A1Y2CHT1_9FUNG|nr:glycoside hydrolase/deacetylase [Rhizoclosmatium globosum]|eukprot:ORY45875.1 glycoside hydrolase/deacetylase [Rhizoclosmatium globosum]
MEMMAGGTVSVLATLSGLFYFQPHRLIAVLAAQFPRVIWCLSSNVSTVRDRTPSNESAASNPVPPGSDDSSPSSSSSTPTSMAWTELRLFHLSNTVSSYARALAARTGTLSGGLAVPGDERLAALEEGTLDQIDEGQVQVVPGVKAKLMALTIDDSPSEHTAEILDILKEHNAKATFFIIGSYVDSTPNGRELLQRMIDEGHELGNHTQFDRPTIGLTREVFEEELVSVDALLQEFQPSPEVKWFRPGSGVFSQEMLEIAEKHAYRTILGCRFPVDTTSRDPRLNAWHVSSGMHPGAIVVLHDMRPWIHETLRILLPTLQTKGYAFVNAGELYRVACLGGESDDVRESFHSCYDGGEAIPLQSIVVTNGSLGANLNANANEGAVVYLGEEDGLDHMDEAQTLLTGVGTIASSTDEQGKGGGNPWNA